VLVQVHLARLAVHELARASEPETLLGTGVRLHLRHLSSISCLVFALATALQRV
jgi:hypothetical protein